MRAKILLKPLQKGPKKPLSSQTSPLRARPFASRITSAYFELSRAHSMFLKPDRGFHHHSCYLSSRIRRHVCITRSAGKTGDPVFASASCKKRARPCSCELLYPREPAEPTSRVAADSM